MIKCGLAPVLIDLMRRGYATAFAHERRRPRSTISRSRWPGTPARMSRRCCRTAASASAEETGREMNRAIAGGDREELGIGEALGAWLETIADPRFAPLQPAAPGLPRTRRR